MSREYVRNETKYAACQLITAFNAAIFFGLKPPRQKSREFERLISLGGCRYGSCIPCFLQRKVYPKLGLSSMRVNRPQMSDIEKFVDEGFPVAVCILSKWVGSHSILIVGWERNTIGVKRFLVTGWNPRRVLSRLAYVSIRQAMYPMKNVNRWIRVFYPMAGECPGV